MENEYFLFGSSWKHPTVRPVTLPSMPDISMSKSNPRATNSITDPEPVLSMVIRRISSSRKSSIPR
ncbi:MAG: hypothetical protein ACE5JP_17030, partial [Candidatus Bipolaricaulia bacterium]